MRSGLGSTISTTRASAKDRLAFSIRARTRSPGTRAADEDHEAVRAPDACPTVGERVDRDLDLLALPGSRALCCGGLGHADYARRLRCRPTSPPTSGGRGVPILVDREYYLHYSGLQDDFAIEPIYDRHSALFSREAVDEPSRDDAPRTLLEFAVQGLVGRETKDGAAELARREAALELEWDGEPLPFRSAAVGAGERARPGPPCGVGRGPQRGARGRAQPALARAAGAISRAGPRARVALDAGAVRGASGIDLGALVGADGVVPRRDRRRLRGAWSSPSCRASSGSASIASARRPGGLLPRPVTRRRLSGRAARAVADRDARRNGHRRDGAGGRDDRHRASAEEVAPCVLRACAGPGRGLPRGCAGGRSRGLRRALPRGRPHRALRARGSRRFRSRTATWATTPLPRPSRSCSSTWSPIPSGCNAGSASRSRLRSPIINAQASSCSCGGTRPSWPTSSSCMAVDPSMGSMRYTPAACPRPCTSSGRPCPGSRTSIPSSTRPAICAPGPSRRHLRTALSERFGPAWFDKPGAGAFLRNLWRAGQGASGAEGILPQLGVDELDFRVLSES